MGHGVNELVSNPLQHDNIFLGLFKVIVYFPNGKSTMTGESIVNMFYSRMRSKGSRFTLGVWGLRVCSLDVAFTVATVRNRPREDRMAVPM